MTSQLQQVPYWIQQILLNPVYWLLLFCYFFFGTIIHCQPTEYTLTDLNTGGGMSGLAALHMFVDEEFKIWVETEDGLDYFNGSQFIKTELPVFPTGNQPNLLQNITNIGEDSIYVYFVYDNQPTQFYRYQKEARKFETVPYSIKNLKGISRIHSCVDHNKTPWLLFPLKEEIIITPINDTMLTRLPLSVLNGSVVMDFQVGENGIWIRDTTFQLLYYKFDGKTKRFKTPELGLYKFEPLRHAFKEDSRGNLWFSIPGYCGLYNQDPNLAEAEIVPAIPNSQLVTDIWFDSKGRKLVALAEARQIVRNYMISEGNDDFKYWNTLAEVSVIPTQIISDDFFERIYYGTHQGIQIVQFNVPYIQKHLVKPDIIANQYGNIITETSYYQEGLSLIVTEAEEAYFHTNRLGSATLDTFHQRLIGHFAYHDKKNKLLYSLLRGNGQFHDKLVSLNLEDKSHTLKPIPFRVTGSVSIGDTLILYLGRDENNMNLAIFHIDSKVIEILPSHKYPLLTNSNVNYAYLDKSNMSIYFSTFNRGLLKSTWSHGTLSPAYEVLIEGLPEKNIISINQNDEGNLLIGTYDGLYIVDEHEKKLLKKYSTSNGLSNNVVAAVLQDSFHRYWLSTFSGLNVIHPDGQRIGSFKVSDGLPHDEFNRNAAHATPDGLLYFGSANGFITIDPLAYENYDSPFYVQFLNAQIHSKTENLLVDTVPKTSIFIAVNKLAHLDLTFSNNSWGTRNQVVYYYKISGLEEEWNQSTTGNLRIDRLPPGKFKIEIKGLSSRGNWSANTISFPVQVYTPFFQKTWVRILGVAILMALAARWYLLAERRRLHSRLEFQHRVSNLELRLLQTQMNPHFIFNALGAIQYYIFNNQRDIAEGYLSKFASLMRMFLESSRNKFISLKDELRLLRGYIELEHMRFPEKFESTFTLDLNDDISHYNIPTMLLQPFVENAINHGLFHLEVKGHLKLSFTDDDKFLYCIIEDNGVGRDSVKVFRAQSARKHKSRATEITEERIEVLKEAENMHIEIDYYDFTPAQDGHNGTRVTIKIPIH